MKLSKLPRKGQIVRITRFAADVCPHPMWARAEDDHTSVTDITILVGNDAHLAGDHTVLQQAVDTWTVFDPEDLPDEYFVALAKQALGVRDAQT